MSLFRVLLLATGALVAGLFLGACSGPEANESARLNIEVGAIQSLSGPAAIYGKSALQGIELAIEEINSTEDDLRMTLSLADDNGQVEAGKQAFEALSQRGVTAIIGPTLSNVALEAMPVAQEAGVPVLGATTTAQGITEIGDYIFRIALTEAVVVPATVARVHEEAPINLAVLVFDSSDAFSRSSADAMRRGLQDIGATMFEEVDVAETPIQERLADLHEQSLDAFLITPLVEQSVDIVRAIRADGFQQTFIGGNGFNTPGISEAGDAVEGAFVGAAWNPQVENEGSESFIEAFRERYDAEPDLFAAQGYSAIYLLLDAVKRAGTTEHAAVRDAMARLRDVRTPLGEVTISERREAVHDPVVQRIEQGKLVALPVAGD